LSVIAGIGLYIIIWWVVIFTVLPYGVTPAPEGDIGHGSGAPARPMLWRKVVITTLLSAVVWLGIYALITFDLVSFRAR